MSLPASAEKVAEKDADCTAGRQGAKGRRPPQGGEYFFGRVSCLRKVAKYPPGEIRGLWQCSGCVRQ